VNIKAESLGVNQKSSNITLLWSFSVQAHLSPEKCQSKFFARHVKQIAVLSARPGCVIFIYRYKDAGKL
jgi:hypothetical protein